MYRTQPGSEFDFIPRQNALGAVEGSSMVDAIGVPATRLWVSVCSMLQQYGRKQDQTLVRATSPETRTAAVSTIKAWLRGCCCTAGIEVAAVETDIL